MVIWLFKFIYLQVFPGDAGNQYFYRQGLSGKHICPMLQASGESLTTNDKSYLKKSS